MVWLFSGSCGLSGLVPVYGVAVVCRVVFGRGCCLLSCRGVVVLIDPLLSVVLVGPAQQQRTKVR